MRFDSAEGEKRTGFVYFTQNQKKSRPKAETVVSSIPTPRNEERAFKADEEVSDETEGTFL